MVRVSMNFHDGLWIPITSVVEKMGCLTGLYMKILGENVCEKQVSPEKQIRAALLKSRFADTILKAHEKTLDQVCVCVWKWFIDGIVVWAWLVLFPVSLPAC